MPGLLGRLTLGPGTKEAACDSAGPRLSNQPRLGQPVSKRSGELAAS